MKTSNLLSNLSPNNSVVLIIFVFLFIAVGMFFLIQRTTEKKKKDEEDKKSRLIEERKELTNQNIKEHMDMGMGMDMGMDMKNINQNGGEVVGDSYTTEENTVTETFNDEVGLFIKKDKTHPEMYSHNPIYIPPFNTGKETRCIGRQVNKPNETNNVQSCANSDLVKVSSDASY